MIAQHYILSSSLLLLCACASHQDEHPAQALPVGTRLPFPGFGGLADGHLALSPDLPHAETPFPVEALAWRTGFSPVQTLVVPPPPKGPWIDATRLPSYIQARTDGSIRLVDLTDSRMLPVFGELDANVADGGGALLVRPLMPIPSGHEVAYVLTKQVKTTLGEPVAFAWYDALIRGEPYQGMETAVNAAQSLNARLAELGIDDVALALSWTVDDGRRQLQHMIDTAPSPTACTLTAVPPGEGATTLASTYQQYSGSFTVVDWLDDAGRLQTNAQGEPQPQGEQTAHLFVHIPTSAFDRGLETAPIWLFGHGIFGDPEKYLGDPSDPGAVLEVASTAGAVVVATTWEGLSKQDLVSVALPVASDIGRFPLLTHRLTSSVAHTAALLRLLQQDGLDTMCGLSGVGDADVLRYYGISLGAIEGATLIAATQASIPAVFHVGGSSWSTMLERSSNWSAFQPLVMKSGLRDATDRQIAYALTQLFWDPIDPAVWSDRLQDTESLWQVSVGDDQVPNLTMWTLARGVGASVILPSPVLPEGLDAKPAAQLVAPAIEVFDAEHGNSDADNLPSPKTHAHDEPRHWAAAKAQVAAFLDADHPAQVQAACGASACTESAANP